MLSVTRRSATQLLLGAATSVVLPKFAWGEDRYFDVHSGNQFKPVEIAVTQFAGDAGPQISDVVTNDFSRSVFLSPIDQQSFTDHITDPDQAPAMDSWKTLNAQFV